MVVHRGRSPLRDGTVRTGTADGLMLRQQAKLEMSALEMEKIWQQIATETPPEWAIAAEGEVAARLLWQRGIRTPEDMQAFCNPDAYEPTEPWAFVEMQQAVERLLLARDRGEKVTIWGDFDADGVTATSVLWEGLGQFFERECLSFTIPNRLVESHGVNVAGVERLHAEGCGLIVTCDTGSTCLAAIARAQELGIDVIITDHHTLPAERPPVVAMLNPRAFENDHPLATLSGVAVAFKLIEALYLERPEIPTAPLVSLLDLVAIGLVADLVELRGDVRYLAQRGIEQLKTKVRPAVRLMLEKCRKAGDRAMDIAFGLGPRINAVSRIHGDARICVEMLTTRDEARARALVEMTELANSRRKALQASVLKQAQAQSDRIDLSTEGALVLADATWPAGVLGIVAGQLARDYHRPVVLLKLDGDAAYGSARSVAGIDLYDLLVECQHLFETFGGHPLAAGLRMHADRISQLRQELNYALRLRAELATNDAPTLAIDLAARVSDLGKDYFRQLSKLEPFGMGNPVPKILLRHVRFTNAMHRNIRDPKGKTVRFIFSTFHICDDTGSIPGIWWGHYAYELPDGNCDVVIELDFMRKAKQADFDYQARLVDVRLSQPDLAVAPRVNRYAVIDRRSSSRTPESLAECERGVVLTECPRAWSTIARVARPDRPLILAFPEPPQRSPQQAWSTLVGWAKASVSSGATVELERWRQVLQVQLHTFELGLQALASAGFEWQESNSGQGMWQRSHPASPDAELVQQFGEAVAEENYQQHYFYELDAEAIAQVLNRPDRLQLDPLAVKP
ncbi:MAG: single-stranded-DNA-specific exonuclease RecJ [Cyanobacteria bacterium P01_E01_bin.48]